VSDFVTRVRELGGLVLRSAKESGEAAAEALEQRAQIQRLALQVRRLDKERSALIRQIGAKVYSLHGRSKVRNQDVLVDCKRIDQIIVDIAGLQKEIEHVRAASLEEGIEVPILSDEAPLDEEEQVTPAAVKPAGTIGEQDLPREGIARASEGRVEFDEEGDTLICDPGPSAPSDPTECEVDVQLLPETLAAPSPGPSVKGPFGGQDLPESGPGKASEGLEEVDESGESLLCTTGPSTPSDPKQCDVTKAPEGEAPRQ
jgi:hypothetical protein